MSESGTVQRIETGCYHQFGVCQGRSFDLRWDDPFMCYEQKQEQVARDLAAHHEVVVRDGLGRHVWIVDSPTKPVEFPPFVPRFFIDDEEAEEIYRYMERQYLDPNRWPKLSKMWSRLSAHLDKQKKALAEAGL